MLDFKFYSEEVFKELCQLEIIEWEQPFTTERAIETIADTFKLTFENLGKTDIPREEVFATSGKVTYRLLETLHCVKYINEDVRDAVIDYITFCIKSKCESIERAQKLLEKCKELMGAKEG